MKRLSFLYFILSICIIAKAQPGKEAWHWQFGSQCALNFNTGTPVIGTTNGYIAGCGGASISDPNTGQLLFYSDGSIVYNKTGAHMFNGTFLDGNTWATQSALIIPKPGDPNIYYLFTLEKCHPNNYGVRYHIIDMSLQGGLGAVTVKNQILTPTPTTEKLVGVRNCNGTDYWVITHPFNSNTFNAYLITSAGLNTIPVVSNVGTVQHCISPGLFCGGTPVCAEGTGHLKASPDGKKLALGINSDSLPILEIFDFDNLSGYVSNPITINYPGSAGPWGLTFSPDNSKLYAIVYPHDTISRLYQYDLSSNIPATIISSQTFIAERNYNIDCNKPGSLGGMQLAPDGKIYIARNLYDSLAVINNPNSLGTSCNFQWGGPSLLSGTGSEWSLPNFIDANYAGIQFNIPDVQQCNTFKPDTIDAGSGYINYYWSTGASTQTIVVNDTGKYWVTVTNSQGCTKTDTIKAYLLKPIKSDTIACGSFNINVTQSGVLGYNWFDANHNPIRNFTQSGNYWVDISYLSGCAIRDSIHLTIAPIPSVNIGPDTTFCIGELNLNAQNPKSNYLWSTGETTQNIVATKPGTYWVHLTDTNGCKTSDTMIVRSELNAFNFKMSNIVTPNNDNINDVIDFGTLQFSELQIEIYNRWGNKIFESSDPKCIWKPIGDDGTYFYTAQYRIDCGSATESKTLKGYITVIR